MKAIDLLGGHSWACIDHGRERCICDLAARQQAARDLDARVEALEGALREARNDVLFNALRTSSERSGDLLARIDALLAEVLGGR